MVPIVMALLPLADAKPTDPKAKALFGSLNKAWELISTEQQLLKALSKAVQESHQKQREEAKERTIKEGIRHDEISELLIKKDALVEHFEKIVSLSEDLGWKQVGEPGESFEALSNRYLMFLKQKLNIP